jgi:hypothetical protein
MLKGLRSYSLIFLFILFFLQNVNTTFGQNTNNNATLGAAGIAIAVAGGVTALVISSPGAVIDLENKDIRNNIEKLRQFSKPLKFTNMSKDFYGTIKSIDTNSLKLNSDTGVTYKIKYITNIMDLESAAKKKYINRIKWGIVSACTGIGLIVGSLGSTADKSQGPERDAAVDEKYIGIGLGSALVGVSILVFTIRTQDEIEWDNVNQDKEKDKTEASSMKIQIKPDLMYVGALQLDSKKVYMKTMPCITASVSF